MIRITHNIFCVENDINPEDNKYVGTSLGDKMRWGQAEPTLAQLVEQLTVVVSSYQQVAGSIPASRIYNINIEY
jgi:hypothetical protein